MTHIRSIPVQGIPSGVPKVRQKKPSPFQRPRIDLDAGRVKRDWQHILVCNVVEGDIVPGVGRVERVEHLISAESEIPFAVELYGGEDNVKRYPGTEEILVFAPEGTSR